MHLARNPAARPLLFVAFVLSILLAVMSSLATADPSVLTPSLASWDFGNTDIHAGAPTQTFGFTNLTANPILVDTAEIVGAGAAAYRITSDGCSGITLWNPAQCSVQVTFAPTGTGTQAAALEITDASGTQDIPLSGAGITGTLSAVPNVVSFTPEPWFNGGQQQSLTIQDSNDAGVQAATAVITGPDAADFSIGWGQNCGTQQYSPGSLCGMGIDFNPPNGPGTFSAQLEITSDSQTSPLIIPISATSLNGPHVVVTPLATDFGSVAIGSSVARTVTVSNDGDFPMQVQGTLLITGTPADLVVANDTCSQQTVDVGSTCQVTVTYRPSAARELDASVLVLTNGPGAPTPAGFTGEGVDPLSGGAVVSGHPAAGSTLTCSPTGDPTGTTFAYAWLRNGRATAESRTSHLELRDADVGARFACRIDAANSVSSEVTTSRQTAAVTPMSLVGESGAFTDAATCREVQVIHRLRLGNQEVVVANGSPVTPWAPLTLTAARTLTVRLDGRIVGRGRTATISPQTLWSFADGGHQLTVSAAGTEVRVRVVLEGCALAARFDGGPSRSTTISASARYGVRSLSFRLPSRLHLAVGAGRVLGWVTVGSAGVPIRGFDLVGAATESNAVTVRLSRQMLVVTGLPPRTGVVSIALRAGVVFGQPGTMTLTARDRSSGALLRARTPTGWLR